MKIIEFNEIDERDKIIEYLGNCEWSAGKFLSKLIKNKELEKTLGDNPKIFFIVGDEEIIGYCTLTKKDAIDDESLFPWIGFLYVEKEYRGNRYSQRLIEIALEEARNQNYDKVYLETDHEGFYEKYGFEYMENRLDVWEEDARIYFFDLKKD